MSLVHSPTQALCQTLRFGSRLLRSEQDSQDDRLLWRLRCSACYQIGLISVHRSADYPFFLSEHYDMILEEADGLSQIWLKGFSSRIVSCDEKPALPIVVQSYGWAREELPSRTLIFESNELEIRPNCGDCNCACGPTSPKCLVAY